jgi:IMP dehydrogenase
MFQKCYTYDDVALVPQFNNILSRTEPDLTSWLTKNTTIGMPLIPANMDTVISAELAKVMIANGGLPIFHRFCPLEEQIKFVQSYPDKCYVSLGVNNVENLKPLFEAGAKGVCIDIAHGHSLVVMNLIREIKSTFPDKEVIAGNICTPMAYNDLVNAGADCCKVGIGGGSACSTRIVTGFGIPQFSAIYNISEYAYKLKVPIIADGGIRNSRDIVLSLAAGASSVMIGNLFAKTRESAAKKYNIFNKDYVKREEVAMGFYPKEHIKVHFRGQASADFQTEFYGQVKPKTVPEGIDFMSDCSGSAQELIDELLGGVRSGLTYGSARNIKELQRKAEFVEVTNNYSKESAPRPNQ